MLSLRNVCGQQYLHCPVFVIDDHTRTVPSGGDEVSSLGGRYESRHECNILDHRPPTQAVWEQGRRTETEPTRVVQGVGGGNDSSLGDGEKYNFYWDEEFGHRYLCWSGCCLFMSLG
jgi:hypothetical protein